MMVVNVKGDVLVYMNLPLFPRIFSRAYDHVVDWQWSNANVHSFLYFWMLHQLSEHESALIHSVTAVAMWSETE